MSTNRLQSLLDVRLDDAEVEVVALENPSFRPKASIELWAIETWRYTRIKRALDLSAALFLTALFAIPGVLIAILIVITSPGPVFYKEQRIGQRGRPFKIWKFRSMRADAAQMSRFSSPRHSDNVLEWRMHKHLPDPRITPLGRLLRNSSLDELPQLINVLRGEMSLVGPRPIVETELSRYGDLVGYYLSAVPGMSGLWQVSGRSNLDYVKRAELDMQYVESWNLLGDINILLRTLPTVVMRAGAR